MNYRSNCLSGYKVFFVGMNGNLASAVFRGSATYHYATNEWNYARCGPLFVFEYLAKANAFARDVAFSTVRRVWYVPLRTKVKNIQSGTPDLVNAEGETEYYWRNGRGIFWTRTTSAIAGTAFASAVWIGSDPDEDPDMDRIESIVRKFGAADSLEELCQINI